MVLFVVFICMGAIFGALNVRRELDDFGRGVASGQRLYISVPKPSWS